MSSYEFVGVDIAKDKFDIALSIKNHTQHAIFSNDQAGYRLFNTWLAQHTSSPWVCMEATGHYSEGLAEFLTAKHHRVSVTNPYQIKHFAKAMLARNKNDRIDARIIAQFGQRMEPRLYQPKPAEQQEIRELTKVLEMMKSQLTQLTNQLHSIQGKAAQKILAPMIKKLKKEIAQLEQQIEDLITNNQELNKNFSLLMSIKGIGKRTATQVLARMPDVASFSGAKQFAAYIGITPKQHQSGKLTGKTTISRLGDSRLRKSLYMAALVAKRHNEALQSFVERLQDRGKTPKTIVCAVMRKLAHIIFGVLKNKTVFCEKKT